MTDKQFALGFLSYLLIGLLTFGASYNLDYDPPKRLSGDMNSLRAAACGILWPAYWAQVGFRFLRPSTIPVPAEQP